MFVREEGRAREMYSLEYKTHCIDLGILYSESDLVTDTSFYRSGMCGFHHFNGNSEW